MALWNEQAKKGEEAPAQPAPRATAASGGKSGGKSVIDAGLTFKGTVEGDGDIQIAGQFEGDINIHGNLTIEAGAKLSGSVSAAMIRIAGELEGNVSAASAVELLDTGMVNGDITAGSLTVAAGSKMRGRADVGFGNSDDARATRPAKSNVSRAPTATDADKGKDQESAA